MIFFTTLAVVTSGGETVFQRERVICKAAFLLFKPLEEVACFPE